MKVQHELSQVGQERIQILLESLRRIGLRTFFHPAGAPFPGAAFQGPQLFQESPVDLRDEGARSDFQGPAECEESLSLNRSLASFQIPHEVSREPGFRGELLLGEIPFLPPGSEHPSKPFFVHDRNGRK